MSTRQVNPLPQLILDRAHKLRDLLAETRWVSTSPVGAEIGPLRDARQPVSEVDRGSFAPVAAGAFFADERQWKRCWFRVDIPEATEDERGRRYLRWRCQGESTVYHRDLPWAGLDIGHPECVLPDDGGELLLDCGCWQTGIWEWAPATGTVIDHRLRFDGAELCVQDEDAWHARWDVEVLLGVTMAELEREGYKSGLPQMVHRPPLDQTTPLVRVLLAGLDRMMDAYRVEGAAGVRTTAADVIASLPAEAWQPTATLLGHAHLDLVWLWPEHATEHKAVHTAATLERLFEKYPEFVFSQSSPPVYRTIQAHEPGQYQLVKNRISEGRWEATGAMEVESDTLVPCGEAFVRSVLLGQREFERIRGEASTLCWLPDTFGYAACVPQILKLAGIDRFYTTKLSWSMINRFPYSAFRWRSPDGSEVVSYLGPQDYNQAADPKKLREAAALNRQLDVVPEILVPTGYGDGAGGPSEAMLERARRMNSLSGVPKTRWGSAESFFDRLSARSEKLPVWEGELYLECHRGTLTSQSEMKRLYRAAERALQSREAVRAIKGLGPLSDEAWQRLIFSQFHDALPGSSIGLVYEQLLPELRAIADEHNAAASEELGGDAEGLFNPLPCKRVAVVGQGSNLRQITAEPLSDAVVVAESSEPVTGEGPDRLWIDPVRAEFENGELVGLNIYCRDLDVIGRACLTLAPDNPAYFDAWDVDHDAARLAEELAPCGPPLVTQHGNLRTELSVPYRIGRSSSGTLKYRVDAGVPVLFAELEIDWQEDHALLRYEIPTAYRGSHARYGAPFGAVSRPQRPGTTESEAMWEVAGSRWAAATRDDMCGLAIMTEAKYGFSCRDGRLGVSLLRAPTFPDERADRGNHVIRWAIGAYGGWDGWKIGDTFDKIRFEPEALFGEWVRGTSGSAEATVRMVTGGEIMSACPSSLNLSWVKPSDDGTGYVLRVHELRGRRDLCSIEFREPPARVELVDLLERPLAGREPLECANGCCTFEVRPYDLISLKVTR
ncbi:MAG: glycoside hydrolase family 38 C-terminal domain-containing protein [Planctomycetota bacterium]